MTFFLLPSKHWLIALLPLSVACAALAWHRQESGPENLPSKPPPHPSVINQSTNPRGKEIGKKENQNPVKPSPMKVDPWEFEESMNTMEKKLTVRLKEIREMQKNIEFSLKKIDLKKIQSDYLIGMPQGLEKSDFIETKLINQADSLLDIHENDLKKSLEKAAKNLQQVKMQLRSYQEILMEMKEMAYRKNGRFNINID